MSPPPVLQSIRKRPRVLAIVAACAERRGVTVEEVASLSRLRAVRLARREAWKQMKQELGWSPMEIAILFQREASTVRDVVNGRRRSQGSRA